jgi:hypothetical protein
MYNKKIKLFIALLLLISTFGFSAKSSKGYYLCVYFTGNVTPEQQICYVVSDNGVDFTPLNDGRPIIASDTIAVMKAVRDPHLQQACSYPDTERFYRFQKKNMKS